MVLHPAGPCGGSLVWSGSGPPAPLERSASRSATASSVRRARHQGGAATAAAARDDTRSDDEEQTEDEQASAQKRAWSAQYDFERRCTVYVQHADRQISYAHPALQSPRSDRCSRHESALQHHLHTSLPFAELSAASFANGMQREIKALLQQPQPNHAIHTFEQGESQSNAQASSSAGPPFVRLLDSLAGISIRRHFDLAAMGVSQMLSRDCIRSEEELLRARRDSLARLPPGAALGAWRVAGEPQLIVSLVATVADKIGNKKAKQLLQHPTAVQLLAFLDFTPNGGLAPALVGSATAAAPECSPFEFLWLELEASARILTLQLGEVEMLVKLSLSLARKSGTLPDLLRCVSLWQRVKALYGPSGGGPNARQLRIPHLLHVLNTLSLDVLNTIWARINDSDAQFGTHLFAAQFRHLLLARPELKLTPPLSAASPASLAGAGAVSPTAAAGDAESVSLSSAISFLLAHVGLLAETHVWFSRFNHLRAAPPLHGHTHPLPPPQANCKSAALTMPLVLDVRPSVLASLVDTLDEAVSVRHNERINFMLNYSGGSMIGAGGTGHGDSPSGPMLGALSLMSSPLSASSTGGGVSDAYRTVAPTIDELFSASACSRPEHHKSVRLLVRLLSNIVSEPGADKYRRIKSSHSTFEQLIGRYAERVAVLRAVGFVDEPEQNRQVQAARGGQGDLLAVPSAAGELPASPQCARMPLSPMAGDGGESSPMDTSAHEGETPVSFPVVPAAAADEFIFLPTSSLDLRLLQHMIGALQRRLSSHMQLEQLAASSLSDRSSAYASAPVASPTSASASASSSSASSSASSPPFPFLPHVLPPSHPLASQQDYLHVLSLLKLFFHTARTWHIDPVALGCAHAGGSRGSVQPVQTRCGSNVWRKLADLLLSLLEVPQLIEGGAAMGSGSTVLGGSLSESNDVEQSRAEKERVVDVLMCLFPLAPPQVQLSIVQAALRDDVLRTALVTLLQEEPGCFHLLPRRSPPGPYKSVWERILYSRPAPPASVTAPTPADTSSALHWLTSDPQLVHNLIAQFEGGALRVAAPSASVASSASKLHGCWSGAARKLQDFLYKTQQMSSTAALLSSAHAQGNGSGSGDAGYARGDTSVFPSPVLSPQSSSLMGLALPSLSLGPRQTSNTSSSSSSSSVGAHGRSPSTSDGSGYPQGQQGRSLASGSATSLRMHAPIATLPQLPRGSPLPSPVTKAGATTPLQFPESAGSAAAASSSSSSMRPSPTTSPQLSASPAPSPFGSPLPTSPGSPHSLSGWAAGRGGADDSIESAQYTALVDSLLGALAAPHSLSPMSLVSPSALSVAQFQYGMLLQTLLSNWHARALVPLTSHDALLAPQLLKQALSLVVQSATRAVDQAKQIEQQQQQQHGAEDVDMNDGPDGDKPSGWQSQLRSSPLLASLTPLLLNFSALLAQLPVSLDPLFLAQLYALHTALGGFDACAAAATSSDPSASLTSFIRPPRTSSSAGDATPLYRDYFKRTLPSDAVLDFVRASNWDTAPAAPDAEAESGLVRALKAAGPVPAAAMNAAIKLQHMGAGSVIPATFLPLHPTIQHCIETNVFRVGQGQDQSSSAAVTPRLYPAAASLRLHQSSLLTCQLCGSVCSTPQELWAHARDPTAAASAHPASLCASEGARWSFLRQSLLWLIASASRQLASADLVSDMATAAAAGPLIDVRVHPDGRPMKQQDSGTAGAATSEAELAATQGSTRSQAIPKSAAQWLKSDLFKGGLEGAFLHPSSTAASPSFGSAGAGDLFGTGGLPFGPGPAFSLSGAGEDRTQDSRVTDRAAAVSVGGHGSSAGSHPSASAHLFPFFHSQPPSAAVSASTSPVRTTRVLSYAGMDDKILTPLAMDDGGKTEELPLHDKSTRTPARSEDEFAAAKEPSSETHTSIHAHSMRVMLTPLESPSGGGVRSKESQDLLRKSLTITTPQASERDRRISFDTSPPQRPQSSSLAGFGLAPVDRTRTPTASGGGIHTGGDGRSPSESGTAILLPASFTSFPPSPHSESYPHASFLWRLVYGEGEARMLDEAVMAHPSLRVYGPQRRMVGEAGARACRAIVAAMLKHTGKIDMALEFNNLQMRRAGAATATGAGTGTPNKASGVGAPKVPPALLKLWKLSLELLPELITLRQNGLFQSCAAAGCDQTVVEELKSPGLYRCGNGHVSSECVARESVRYEQMAERVMHSCTFLLKLRPAHLAQEQGANASAAHQRARAHAARLRRLLRVKPIHIPHPPSLDLFSPLGGVPAGSPGSGAPVLKRSGSTTLSSWSPSPRTPLTSSPPPGVMSGLPPAPQLRGSANQRTPDTPTSTSTSMSRSSSDDPSAVLFSPRTFPGMVNISAVEGAAFSASARKLRESVRREMASHRWQELRAELIASRMPSLLRAAASPPISSLVMAFCRNVAVDTATRAAQMERRIRATVLVAEQRARGLESLAYIARHAPTPYKALAMVQWNSCIQAWQHRAASASSSSHQPSPLARALESASATPSSSWNPAPLMVPTRYDFMLHAVGSPMLAQVQEAFYVGMGVNLGLMHRCVQQLGLRDTTHTEHESESTRPRPYSAWQAVTRLRANRPADQPSSRISPSFGGASAFTSSVSFGSSFAALVLSRSECVSLLLLSLNSWFVAYSDNRHDFTFVHMAQLLPFLAQLCFHFNEVDGPDHAGEEGQSGAAGRSRTASAESLGSQTGQTSGSEAAPRASDHDRRRCRAVGHQARRLFRLLALSALTQQQPLSPSSATEDDGVHGDSTKDEAAAAALAGVNLGGSGRDGPLGAVLQADSLEASVLHQIFTRLDDILHHRLLGSHDTAEASSESTTDSDESSPHSSGGSSSDHEVPLHSFAHPQDERDCFEAISLLLLSCASVHVKLALTHHGEENQTDEASRRSVSPMPSPSASASASASSSASPPGLVSASLSSRCFYLLSQLLHPSVFPKLSMRCQRRSIGLCNLLLPMVTPAVVELLWNQQDEAAIHSAKHTHVPSDQQQQAHAHADAMDMSQDHSTAAVAAAALDSSSGAGGDSSQLVTYLLLSIGYYSCGRFLEPSSSPFPHSSDRCDQLVSELISLVRNLHASLCWMSAVSGGLSRALAGMRHETLRLDDQSALDAFYSAYAAALVYGGFVEPLRIGGRVLIHRVSSRAEKLSQREAGLSGGNDSASASNSSGSGSGSDASHGTIVAFEAHQAVVVVDGDAAQRLHVHPLGALEPLAHYPCTQPFHLYGQQGRENLAAIVRFINAAFCNGTGGAGTGADIHAAFSLFPLHSQSTPGSADARAAQLSQYMQSLLKVHAMRALVHCVSLVLTRPELVAQNVRQYLTATGDRADSINSIDTVVQCILRECGDGVHASGQLSGLSSPPPSSSRSSALPLMSNLLLLAQQVIPLSGGLGKLDEINVQLHELHALMHDQADEHREETEMPRQQQADLVRSVRSDVHADLLARGLQLYPGDLPAAATWAHRKQQELRAAQEDRKREVDSVRASQIQSLLDLGFDEALCKRALLLHNGDLSQSLSWLRDHGRAETEAIRRGQIQDVWGLEGVDFYQEKGHWTPQVEVAADRVDLEAEAAAAQRAKTASSSSSTRRGEEKKSQTSGRVDTARSQRSSGSHSGSLPHSPPPMDPYRRLALYTGPQMAGQAFRSDLVHHQLTGRPLALSDRPLHHSRTRGPHAAPAVGWSLEAADVRAGVGQRLRVSRIWVAQQLAMGRRGRSGPGALSSSSQARQLFKWYFLTEDNNWAPLDAKDMTTLDQCYESGTSFCWIGVEEKSPSLIRLDKMCMYNELTGHGRPLRRKAIEANPLKEQTPAEATAAAAAVAAAEKAAAAQAQAAAAAASASASPPASLCLFDSLPADRQSLAANLSAMGFPREWCALALSQTGFNAERAADWLLTDANVTKCEAHDRNIAIQEDARAAAAAAAAATALEAQRQKEEAEKAKHAAALAQQRASVEDTDMHDVHRLSTPSQHQASKKQKLSHHVQFRSARSRSRSLAGGAGVGDGGNATSFVLTPALAREEVEWDALCALAGKVGHVVALSSTFQDATAGAASSSSSASDPGESAKVLLEWIDDEVNCARLSWVPLSSLEWDTEALTAVMPDYAMLHATPSGPATSSAATGASTAAAAGKKVTHLMQQRVGAMQQLVEMRSSSDTMSDGSLATPAPVVPSNTLFHLAVDVSTSAFIVYARRVTLLLIYLLSLPQPQQPQSQTGASASFASLSKELPMSPLSPPLLTGDDLVANVSTSTSTSLLPPPPAQSASHHLSTPRGLFSRRSAGSGGGGGMPLELIAHLSAPAIMRIIKLVALDSPLATSISPSCGSGGSGGCGSASMALTLPIEDVSLRWSEESSAAGGTGEGEGCVDGEALQGAATCGAMPSTPGLVPRNRLDIDLAELVHRADEHAAAAAAATASTADSPSDSTSAPPAASALRLSSAFPAHPLSIDVWLVLSTLLHNSGPLLSSPSRDHLFALLLDDAKRTLQSASYFVRDIDTEHPYQSNVHERGVEVSIEGASSLLVTFDRRCNLNQSHAALALYADAACTDELAVFSGSGEEFSHTLVAGSRFYYTFHSGALRAKPYEFGFRFRVRPMGFRMSHENDALHVVGPALASAINLGLATPGGGSAGANGGSGQMPPAGASRSKAHAYSFTLGWPLLVLLTDSPSLSDTLLAHPLSSDLLQSMLRYLTVCRSPCKVMVTRALTSLCVRMRAPTMTVPRSPAVNMEIHLRVMEQLYESNTASGWGSSPFLCALVDLIRLRPQQFHLSDSDLWSVDSIDSRPPNWFFLTVLRAESLSKALLHSQRLPHVRVVERAMAEVSDVEILRWCLKQPELCLKLHKQTRGWNNARREWMVGINGFTAIGAVGAVLVQLKDSLLPECYRSPSWTLGNAAQEWEARVRAATSVAAISTAYMELEAALKWGDQYPENERAFGDTWASRRSDWVAAMRGLASASVVRVASPAEALEARWTRAMDEALVAHVDQLANKSARRLMSLTLRDIEPLTPEQLATSGGAGAASAPGLHPLRNVSIEQLRARFAVLKLLSTDYMRLLPVVDLSFHRTRWSVAHAVKPTAKRLIFHQSKMYLWRSMLGRLYSEERPQFVILNRHEAAKRRPTPTSRLQHSLFYQLFAHVGLLCDPSSLRRRGQAWMVKFVGEGGHDVGGMYNESLVELCNELQSEVPADSAPDAPTAEAASAGGGNQASGSGDAGFSANGQLLLPLFRLCPNGHHAIGDHRSSFLPNPSARRPLHLAMLEFVGRLCGICCLDNNRALPLTLPSLVWKCMVGEPLELDDLRQFDWHSWNLIHRMRHPNPNPNAATGEIAVNEETFEYLFPDLTFSVEIEVEEGGGGSGGGGGGVSRSKRVIDLLPNGRSIPVTFARSQHYALLLEKFYLKRYNQQINAMCRGMSSIIPFDFLSMFGWSELETLVTGNPDMDVQLLRSKTEYRGNLSAFDKHVLLFWEALEEMTQEQRQSFLQFVWGRNRLPNSALGFGKDLFKLSDHAAALAAGTHDHYLPVAHTCFFALELPRYSSKSVMSAKLLYAISNCSSIDGDATHEGRANMAMSWEDDDE